MDLDLDLDVDLDLVLDLDLALDLDQRASMNFRNLHVYQLAIRFLPSATAISDRLPPRHTALADQLRRAALSIPLNIAEGSGKSTVADQRRFYVIARGSAMECAAILDACSALSLVEQAQADELNRLLLSVVRMLSKMCRL